MSSRKKKYNILTKDFLNASGVSLTPKQNKLRMSIEKNSLTIVSGAAGTSKTFTTCYTALKLLSEKRVESIVITKPLIESSFPMGYLPGTIDEKTFPFMKSYISNFSKIIGKEKTTELLTNEVIQIETLNFMRGETYDNAILLLDEGQNLPMKDLMLWITRLGKNSKAVLMGDISQYDISEKKSSFRAFRDILIGMDDFDIFEFDKKDIVRNPFLVDITDRYEQWKYSDNNPEYKKNIK